MLKRVGVDGGGRVGASLRSLCVVLSAVLPSLAPAALAWHTQQRLYMCTRLVLCVAA